MVGTKSTHQASARARNARPTVPEWLFTWLLLLPLDELVMNKGRAQWSRAEADVLQPCRTNGALLSYLPLEITQNEEKLWTLN